MSVEANKKEKLDRLRAKRGGNRGVCTKLAKEAQELIETRNEGNLNRSEVVHSILSEKLKLLNELDEEILGLCDISEIQGEIEETTEIASRILDALKKLEKFNRGQRVINKVSGETSASSSENTVVINTIEATNNPEQTSNNSNETEENVATSQFQENNNANTSTISANTNISVKPKLPKLTLPKFKGVVTMWNTFWDSYESAIHTNDDISPIDKFNYLNSLLEGPALRAIQGLTLTSANYNAAIEILNQRFGRPQQIVTAHMDELLKIQPCATDKLSALRFVYDKISVHVRGLTSLGISTEQYGSLLIPVIMSKMPSDIRLEVARKASKDVWKIEELLETIKFEIEAREASEATKATGSNSTKFPKPFDKGQGYNTAKSLVAKDGESFKIQCVYCEGQHYSASCEKVVNSEARKKILGTSGRCFNCLRKGHPARSCTSERKCRHCSGRHHQSICAQINKKNDNEAAKNEEPKLETNSNLTVTATRVSKGTVLLQTARAIATNGKKSIPVRVLFDTGSQRTYITNSVQKRLNLKPTSKETLNLNTFGDNTFKRKNCDVYKLTLESRTTRDSVEITAINFPTICSPVRSRVNTSYAHLAGLDLADYNDDNKDDTIDILVGADHYWDFVTGDVVRGDDGPTALSSKLGWLLSGRVNQNPCDDRSTNACLILAGDPCQISAIPNPKDELVDSLKRFWEVESIGITDAKRKCAPDDNFLESIRFTGQRYEVGLPWKEEQPLLNTDYDLCHNRLRSLHSKLRKEPELLREYDKSFKDQLEMGIIEKVKNTNEGTKDDINDRVHYLPHHGVVRQDKATTKLRVVYDGSATTRERNYSLNDCLSAGPNNIPHLFDILVKFRSHPVGLVADIEKAFLMVGINEADRDMLRFLWLTNVYEPLPEVVEYRFTRLVFGLRPSPAILGATIDHHLRLYEDEKPDVVDVLRNGLYVDDLVTGAEGDNQAVNIYKGTKEVMLAGGFNLRKWTSNSSAVVEAITQMENAVGSNESSNPVENEESASRVVIEETESYTKMTINQETNVTKDKCVKVLGVPWDTETDAFTFDLSVLVKYARSLPATKRSVLKISAKIFDPVGFLSPFVIRMKSLFQELCIDGSQWDDELSEGFRVRWNAILSELDSLSSLQIQRCYFNSSGKPTKIELHGFSDASKIAYAAVIYIRSLYENGTIEIRLLASKTKVAPIKEQTIPRLELLGANILARLMAKVQECLSKEDCKLKELEIFNWTDSMTVLCWITNDKLWKQYVLHRVKEIHQLTAKESWGFCPGKENPADLPSRGMKASDLISSMLWWQGPTFLQQPEDQWPNCPTVEPDAALSEVVKNQPAITHSLVTKRSESSPPDITKIINCEDFSSLTRLLRVTAYVLRFIRNIKKSLEDQNSVRGTKQIDLSATEINAAEIVLVRSVQNISFSSEIDFLTKKKDESTPNRVRQFGLFLDDNKLLRCKGRINNANVSKDSKNPMLLPTRHPIVDLIVRDVHQLVKHNGIRDTLTTIRERFWILRGRQVVKRVLRRCVVCRKAEGAAYGVPPPPDLPPSRVAEDPPFTNVGLDFAGPLFVRTSIEGSSKVYVLLFTCASTRGVHLELTPSLNVSSFLQAFRRFASRRGLPSLLMSDNAKTFKAACKEIRKLTRADEVRRYLTNNRITWQFIVERAPWWGGFWERLVRSIKRPLKKIVGRSTLTYEELSTLIIEIECLINSRPITYVFDDDEACSWPLTPSNLIYGRRITTMPNSQHYEITSTYQSLTKKARHHQKVLQQLTKQWRTEYLLGLREQSIVAARNSKTDSVSVGDIVILRNDQTARCFWKLARVEELLRGADNQVRAAIVRVLEGKSDRTRLLRRSVNHLIPIEVKQEPEDTEKEKAVEQVEEEQTVESEARPRRNAAVIGELRRAELMNFI
jgi:hypothetical protein